MLLLPFHLTHPPVKMRGYKSGSLFQPDFFIILDRLYATLDKKMEEWECALPSNCGFFSFLLTKEQKAVSYDILLQRLVTIFDLASAFSYMHQNQYVSLILFPPTLTC